MGKVSKGGRKNCKAGPVQVTMKLKAGTRASKPTTRSTAQKELQQIRQATSSFCVTSPMSKSPKVKLSGLREKPPRLRLRAASFASTSSSMDDGCDPRRSMTPKNRLVFDESSFKTPVMSPTLFEEKKHSPRSENIRARIMSTFRQKTNDRRRKSLRGSATILNFHFHDLQITPKTPTSRCRLAKKGFK